MPDLASPADLTTFLETGPGPFASSSVVPLIGGLGNYTFRLTLKMPYQGKRTAVLKHGKPYIPSMREMAFDLERQRFEVEAMRYARSLLPADSPVTVPEVYLFDSNASAIIMEDCAATSTPSSDTYTLTLKEYLLHTEGTRPSPPNESIARQIGAALGEFIATLHGKSKTDKEVLDRFNKNQQARVLSAWATYGRLRSTLSGADTLPALSEPPFEISESELEKIDVVAEKAQTMIRTSREALVHGDFWPGNVLVRFKATSEGGDEVDRIYLIDWELVKPGSRGVGLGQFLGELYQASQFCEENVKSVEAVRISLLEAYRNLAESEEGDVRWEKVADEAVVHVGAHLVIWTPRAWTWAEKERIRSVVSDGVRFLLSGEDSKLLEKSPAGVLLASSTS